MCSVEKLLIIIINVKKKEVKKTRRERRNCDEENKESVRGREREIENAKRNNKSLKEKCRKIFLFIQQGAVSRVADTFH